MTYRSNNRPTWAVIDLDSLAFNFHSCKDFIGNGIKVMAVVKADAYGHGAVECSKRLEAEGVDWFGVAIPEEGIELRQAGVTVPILCLGGFWAGQEAILLDNDLTPVIFQIEQAKILSAVASKRGVIVDIHVKVDTGMGRIGVRFDELLEFVEGLKTFTNLNIDGVMSHFAVADDLEQNDFTQLQQTRLDEAVATFRENGFAPKWIDMANSPGAIAHPESRGNMVRLGGILYGLGGDVLPQRINKPALKPVLALYTQIAHIKRVAAGESLGYGRTFLTERDSVIATLPIGYHDGYRRSLSNRGRVIVNGNFAPVVGRISMDWTIVDVTDVPTAKVGDKVTLIGDTGERRITVEEIGAELGTISYEITCGINGRVPKRFYNSGD
ncbi:MAG: alanine racemase [Saprospiraceae bacterium]|nr:alanine racemase [Pyrinomonadaceae bacterium]